MRLKLLLLLVFSFLLACKEESKNKEEKEEKNIVFTEIKYATGFEIANYEGYKILKVNSPWANAEQTFTYLLIEDQNAVPENITYDEKITLPIDKLVVTSTTHIPSLESLGQLNTLVGFPHTDYISSEKARQLIRENKIKEIGAGQTINTEVLLALQPQAVIASAVNGDEKSYKTVQKSGIPIIYNGDWTEEHPLGKAEWIKFFGTLYNQEKLADSIFKKIETNYRIAKATAKNTEDNPSVLSGGLYQNTWYCPQGNSWQAQFIADASGDYIFKHTEGTGSLSLSFENVFENGKTADIWISPGVYASYDEMKTASQHYQKFDAFQNKNVYTVTETKGETGGLLFYELAPNRPDLVLIDLIKIFHPELYQDQPLTFFKPLE
ncbi:ABC transporter substrate-binding protein [Mesonia sp. K7]|uniref:ABC transporter substrate-binding protein n=1 Tax=Mesonia sp. K7 TaxID=2218606 RepID=UPI000DA80B44|nr:ABC transporter substrate-binding protein [Mesonia sp. K7]PZD77882.1 ABC transporter substrate-binding protein [Mesonia sp. K7]